MPRVLRTFLAPALLIAASAPAGAQSGAVQAGDLVRARVVAPAAGPVGFLCAGRVDALAGDTLLLARSGGCPGGAYLADVRVARGDRGSRWAHAGVGVVVGGLVGGVLARLQAGDGCRVAPCDDGDFVVAAKTVVGTGAGALAGAVVGALLPAGTRWVPAGAPRPLRVAGLALRPGIRVALGPGRP